MSSAHTTKTVNRIRHNAMVFAQAFAHEHRDIAGKGFVVVGLHLGHLKWCIQIRAGLDPDNKLPYNPPLLREKFYDTAEQAIDAAFAIVEDCGYPLLTCNKHGHAVPYPPVPIGEL